MELKNLELIYRIAYTWNSENSSSSTELQIHGIKNHESIYKIEDTWNSEN
jgi:hypothetical protein